MEVQDVIVVDLSSRPDLEQLGWKSPRVHVHATGDQEIDRAVFCRFHDDHRTDGAGEAVLTSIVVEAHTYRDVARSQFHVSAV